MASTAASVCSIAILCGSLFIGQNIISRLYVNVQPASIIPHDTLRPDLMHGSTSQSFLDGACSEELDDSI